MKMMLKVFVIVLLMGLLASCSTAYKSPEGEAGTDLPAGQPCLGLMQAIIPARDMVKEPGPVPIPMNNRVMRPVAVLWTARWPTRIAWYILISIAPTSVPIPARLWKFRRVI